MMGCTLLGLTLLALLVGSNAQPPCTLILSNVLRVESEETIIVDSQNTAFDADVEVNDFPHKKLSLVKGRVSVNAGNNFLGTVTLTIPSKDLLKDPKKKQYVYVSVKSPLCPLEKVVLLTFQSGYIVLQADKTIYTPGSQVNYRIFSMNYKLQPVSKAVIIEFLSPDGIIIKRDTIRQESKSGIISQVYKLPELVSVGVWTIAAKYENAPEQNYTTNFEVKEYVLPSFEVSLLPRQKFFHLNDKTFDVDLNVQFLYGKPVNGKAFVIFGVKGKDDGVKKGIPDTLRRISIENGEGECYLDRKDLVKHFKNEEDMLQFYLYLSVTVITDSGSELVEAELENIHIVTSPYKVLFTKTSKYYKPGMPFDIVTFVTNPDGSPANRIRVIAQPGNVEGTTQGDGTARLTLNTAARTSTLPITVKTAHPALTPERQASASMTAIAYKPLGGIENFLHIGITGSELKPGENVAVNFNIRNGDLGTQNQIQHFTYLIINKGRIMTVARQLRQAGQALVTMSLAVTEKHIPSFRIVAYYIVQTTAGREIVSDSVWVDVKDTCMGTLVVTGEKERDNKIQSPGSPMKLKLKAEHQSYVALGATDKGVYVLNSKFRSTQKKVWDSVEKSDIGCTPGGGADSVGVFTDAGLALETNFKMSTAQRSESQCPVPPARRRRSSAVIIEFKTTAASKYSGHIKTCCEDGMRDSPMGHSCERRSQKILEGKECVDAFVECCKHFEKKKADERTTKDEDLLGRSDEDDEYMPDTDITSRSEFDESWFWKVEHMNEKPDNNGISTKVLPMFLKDSITTWEVLAVSLSENKGICIGEPYEIQVMKDFFCDLKLPYSVVRNEQVEIRAVLYNYGNQRIKVRVELTHNPEFCSLSTSKKKFRQEVNIGAHSSSVASFVIVPLNLGNHEIEVKAAVSGAFVSDGVRKKLKVVPEGMLVIQTTKSVTLEPQVKGVDGVQSEKVSPLDVKNIVPRTEIETVITVTGTPVSLMLEEAVDGKNLNHLITVPSGCGEQNMIGMTPSVIATRYLDATNQWEKIGLNRREQAIKNIKQGYAQQLAFRKADNSYGAWIAHPSSTWLTAYVAKVFAMAQTMVDIESNVLCGAIKWLTLERQKPDGIFQETAPVIHQEMIGGMKGSTEPDAALTAFVLIALLESEKTCTPHVNNLRVYIDRATAFLVGQYPTLRKPYTVAITSYALAKAGFLDETKTLFAASTEKKSWIEPGAHFISLEATAYALLALLELKQYELTGPIARWLTEQRYIGVGYGSTQATIVYFQGQAQYQQDIPTVTDVNLDVSVRLPERNQPITYRINTDNAMLARSAQTRVNKGFVVDAKGKGQGTLTVMTVYHALSTEKEKKCNNFDLSVKVTELEDFKGNRPEGAFSSVALEICFQHLKDADATMSIIDVSMLTGFAPDVEELNKLARGVDKYISKFEINKDATERGTLIIYLDSVSHKQEECVKVVAHQIFRVGLIQPASVTVYDYYNPENRCNKFYHLNAGNALLGRICQGDVCRCAEENCYMKQNVEGEITAETRMDLACGPGVDYVYKANLVKVEHNDNYDNYIMKIVQIIKQGTDADPLQQERNFISHRNCRDKLEMLRGRDYLIWGVTGDLWLQPSGYSYIIGKETWIEWWPNDRECQNPENEQLCNDYFVVSENLAVVGCPN